MCSIVSSAGVAQPRPRCSLVRCSVLLGVISDLYSVPIEFDAKFRVRLGSYHHDGNTFQVRGVNVTAAAVAKVDELLQRKNLQLPPLRRAVRNFEMLGLFRTLGHRITRPCR